MKVTVAATQMSITWDIENNIKKADKMIEDAAKAGANIILLQELFEAPYFCQKENYDYFKLAKEFKDNPLIHHFSLIAKKYDVVLPISFFERAGNVFYNSLAMIDADGTVLGLYRKSHIPTGECYEEKFYFTPGDTGFKVFKTKYGRIGAGICWDQWFPETARILALKGAEILFYPTAIGSEPVLPKDSKDHWQNTMCGHAAANIMPVVASNRIGTETEGDSSMTFFGSSFIANEEGNKVEEMNRTDEGFILHTFDLDEIEKKRYSWGVFRDRRCDLYTPILKHNDNN
ncbi:N-carbamoylputrescine amidase [Anaeroplasma bactoclasticum]|jgi:N-carbamoylputrescine amidase|uniref:N-carbamoylputrescine amidase n=1 Tax=Anaeroplasma bactoclasticum TaxID=2088 RepID=A0A397RZU6_9MOLU|nr:N-carbamoylputrescine amidase [Anaeroplasma bactoclasticum]RIA78076.1 N-carbamoylputrescine amidase [Anaeroplasma bactoclasticum]